MKINKWLEDSSFIDKIQFKDKYYLETLLFKVSAFIKNAPVPIMTTYDNQHQSIYLSIGNNKQFFTLDVDISYYDMITLMRLWCSQFYPQYEITVEKQIEYTDEEIIEDLVKKKGMNLNDALLERKTIQYVEKGIIEKVFIKRDEFIIDINGEKQLRLSGTIGNMTPLSKFMEGIRIFSENKEKYSQLEIKNYIENNSKLISKIAIENEIIINYAGKQMLNFFDINFVDLFEKGFKLEQIEGFIFKWGRFKIIFNSKILMNDCLQIYNKHVALKYL